VLRHPLGLIGNPTIVAAGTAIAGRNLNVECFRDGIEDSIVTRNPGARITYLVQDLLNQSREFGLERIRTLTLPLGEDHPYEVVDVRYG
jgi:hypothetical protein